MKNANLQSNSLFDAIPSVAKPSDPFSWEPCLDTEKPKSNNVLISGTLQELGCFRKHYESTSQRLVELSVPFIIRHA